MGRRSVVNLTWQLFVCWCWIVQDEKENAQTAVVFEVWFVNRTPRAVCGCVHWIGLMRSRPSSGQIVGARESLNGRERTGFRLSLFMLMVLRGWRSVSFTYIMRFLEGKKTAILLNETLPTFFNLFKPFIYLFVFFYSLFPLSQFWFCSPWRLLLTFSFLQPLLRPWHHVLFSEVSWQKSCKLQSIFCPRRRSIFIINLY